jgi:hypothetical protein
MRAWILGYIFDEGVIVAIQEVNIPGSFLSKAMIINTYRIFPPGIEYFYIEFSNRRQVFEEGGVVLNGMGGYDSDEIWQVE